MCPVSNILFLKIYPCTLSSQLEIEKSLGLTQCGYCHVVEGRREKLERKDVLKVPSRLYISVSNVRSVDQGLPLS